MVYITEMEVGNLYEGMFDFGGRKKKGKFMFIGKKYNGIKREEITIMIMSNHKLMEPLAFQPTTWKVFAEKFLHTYTRERKSSAELYNITGGN
jgi:hypothetical protein